MSEGKEHGALSKGHGVEECKGSRVEGVLLCGRISGVNVFNIKMI